MAGKAHDLLPARILDLDRGRRVCVAEFGARDGFPVIALHGTPGSRLKYAAADSTATSLGLRLISPDRWGYGGTDAHARPSLSEYARDVRALADMLGLGRFAVIGISGGGPYALGVAAQLGSRVTRLALVAPVGPISETPRREMRPFHRFCFRVLPRIPGGTRLVFRAYRRLLQVAPGAAISVATFRTARADIELAAAADVRGRLAATFREGLRPGASGPVIDLRLFSRAWDVDPADVATPTRLWLGADDRNVPQFAVRSLARKIRQAELTVLGGEGHLWVLRNYRDVLEWVGAAR
jgi:pimeloyl-ACP methyl ester carboxylesterase